MTPYVLLEQEDWFEDEIQFIHRLARSAYKTIDIGANYGLYTLTLGNSVNRLNYLNEHSFRSAGME